MTNWISITQNSILYSEIDVMRGEEISIEELSSYLHSNLRVESIKMRRMIEILLGGIGESLFGGEIEVLRNDFETLVGSQKISEVQLTWARDHRDYICPDIYALIEDSDERYALDTCTIGSLVEADFILKPENPDGIKQHFPLVTVLGTLFYELTCFGGDVGKKTLLEELKRRTESIESGEAKLYTMSEVRERILSKFPEK